MDVSELKQIKDFIEQCKSNPSILEHPELSFFRDYIGGLRRKITSSGGDYKESHLVDEKIYDIIEDTPPHEEDKPNVVELDIDLDDRGIVDPDNDPPQKMGDLSVDVSEENRDASDQVAKNRAMEAISEGKLEVAIEHLTTAILLNPTSAIMYGTRASVYIKMKKPNAAIRDATAALEINPDSAKEYKSRGIARAMLGQWEEAAKDLHMASKIDYGEEISSLLKKVDTNAHKIEEHRWKYDRLRKERVDKKIEYECQRRGTEPQAGFKRKKNEQSSSNRLDGMPGAGFPGGMLGGGFPYGMPGGIPMFGGFPGACFPRGLHRGYPGGEFPGGIPEGYITEYCQVFSDPELSAAFQDSRIFSKLRDLVLNPDNLVKLESDPKMAPILAKLKNICDHQ